MTRRRILVALSSVAVLSLGVLFLPALRRSSGPTAASLAPAEQPVVVPRSALAPEAAAAPDLQVAVPPQDIDPHKAFGSKNAPIIMEIFSDYQCPACKTFFLNTNRQLMDNYVRTGKVSVIQREFPLNMHANTRFSARYARAAASLGKVESVEQALFENQEKWEQNGDVDGTVAAVLSPSDMSKVRALVKGTTLDPLIDKDFALGQTYRVGQTPTTVFHCKGQSYPYAGVMTYDILKQFLEQLLAQK